MARGEDRSIVAMIVGVILIGFGFLALFSIGLPILVAGLFVFVAGVTGAHRTHPAVYWPIAAGAGAFLVTYVLIAPLACSSQATVTDDPANDHAVGATSCTNLVGIDYAGEPGYDPPLWPATAAGAAGAVVAGVITRRLLANREED